MKRYFLLIITILFLSVSCKQNGYKLEYRKSPAGQKYKCAEGNYIDGKKDGVWKYYCIWGQTYGVYREDTYKNGILEGYSKSYWSLIGKTGLADEGYYIDGKKDGIWKYYSFEKNGQLEREEQRKNGILRFSKNYYINGQLSWTVKYDDEGEMYTKCWDEDGNEINCDKMMIGC